MLGQIVAGFGTSSMGAFKTVKAQYESLRTSHEKMPNVQRDLDYLREKIGSVESLDELMDDYRLWSTVTNAFGLGEYTFAKGLFKQVLNSDVSDKTSLVHRMVDPRYREMYDSLQIATKGAANFKDAAWVEDVAQRYVTRSFEESAGEGNPAVQAALYFQRKAPNIKSHYELLGDETLSQVALAAAGLPPSASRMDVDRLVDRLKEKFSLDDLKDPEIVTKLVQRYLATQDAEAIKNGADTSINALAMQTIAMPQMTGFGPPVTINPTLFLK